jgi:DNA-binding MarR family transcriptional regulator
MPAARTSAPTMTLSEQTDVVLAACRLLVAISVRSMAEVEADVTPTQLRVLTILATRGPLSISAVADAMSVHLSNASRVCDRLVTSGLVTRTGDPADRRQAQLTLSRRGRSVVRKVFAARHEAVHDVLGRLPRTRRVELIQALQAFAAAGGEPASDALWSMGWTEI